MENFRNIIIFVLTAEFESQKNSYFLQQLLFLKGVSPSL